MPIKTKATITPYWYTPKQEEGVVNGTRFQLKPLTGVEFQDVELHKDASGQWRAQARSVYSVLDHALVGWDNVLDDAGQRVEFDRFNKKDCIDKLPAEVVSELFADVLIKSRVSEDQEKN